MLKVPAYLREGSVLHRLEEMAGNPVCGRTSTDAEVVHTIPIASGVRLCRACFPKREHSPTAYCWCNPTSCTSVNIALFRRAFCAASGALL